MSSPKLTSSLNKPAYCRYVSAVLPAVLALVRNADAARRDDGARMLRALVAKCSTLDVVAEALAQTVAVLQGSEGKLSQLTQRVGVYGALAALSDVRGKAAALAGQATEAIAAAYVDEVNEEAKVVLLGALSPWLVRCTAWPPAALELVAAGVKAKEEKVSCSVRFGGRLEA